MSTSKRICVVSLHLSATNADLLDQMRGMKAARENPAIQHVVCTVHGFGTDPRELWQIPEVRAFARRLVAMGFVSYLDVFATLDPNASPAVRGALGAAEVYLLGENRLRATVGLTRALLAEVRRMLAASNTKSEAMVGAPASPVSAGDTARTAQLKTIDIDAGGGAAATGGRRQ